MGFEQAAALLNGIYHQATGTTALAATNTSDFVSQANAVLQTGYDKVSNSISSVLARTIFAVRPYSAKFTGIQVDSERWGNHVRKINYIDQDVVNDDRYGLTDGQSVDMYTVRKPKVLQTNFYGGQMYEDWVTIYRDQLDTAFTGPDQFAQFIGGVMQNMTDKLEQFREGQRRETLLNFIGGKLAHDTGNVIHLLDEYQTRTGVNLTPQTVYAPANFAPFIKWLYGYIEALSGLMSNRSIKYHMNITGKNIMRHTPKDRMKAFVNSQFAAAIGPEALSSVFQLSQMGEIGWESVDFWQSIDNPMAINVTPNYLDVTDGSVKAAAAQSEDQVLGIMFDEDAMGISDKSTWMNVTPFNARGGYYNQWYHVTVQTWNDLTENAVILLLDHASA
jgi:hypothetical protein